MVAGLGRGAVQNGFTLRPTRCPTHPLQAALNYAALDLKPFYAGAKVWYQGGFHQVRGAGAKVWYQGGFHQVGGAGAKVWYQGGFHQVGVRGPRGVSGATLSTPAYSLE